MGQRIFLSSTCLDLVDLRSGLKESLEEMGYQVWASEFSGFPAVSGLHNQDNCLRKTRIYPVNQQIDDDADWIGFLWAEVGGATAP
jgi:hypothetical protein